MQTGKEYDVTEVGVFTPNMKPCDILRAGELIKQYKNGKNGN